MLVSKQDKYNCPASSLIEDLFVNNQLEIVIIESSKTDSRQKILQHNLENLKCFCNF